MNSMQQNLKINYKTFHDGLSCMTVFDGFGQIINQLNDEEAEYIYNSLVGNPDRCLKKLKEDNRKLFIDALKAHRRYDPIIEKQESEDFIIVTTEMSIIKYSKLKLAIFWLTHSNDDFYNTFGFSWVPDPKLQDQARTKLNQSMNVGIDLGKAESMQAEIRTLEIPNITIPDMTNVIKEFSKFEYSSSSKKGFRE